MADTEEDMDEWIAAICTIKLLDFDLSNISGMFSLLAILSSKLYFTNHHRLLALGIFSESHYRRYCKHFCSSMNLSLLNPLAAVP